MNEQPAHILVVDDDARIRTLLKQFLIKFQIAETLSHMKPINFPVSSVSMVPLRTF